MIFYYIKISFAIDDEIIIGKDEKMEKKKDNICFAIPKYFFAFYDCFRTIWSMDKKVYIYGFAALPFAVLLQILPLYMPKLVVQGVEDSISMTKLIFQLCALILIFLTCVIVRWQFNGQITSRNQIIAKELQNKFAAKLLMVDYSYLEDKKYLELRNIVKKELFGGKVGDDDSTGNLKYFVKDIFGLFLTLAIMFVYIVFLVWLEWWLVLIFAMLFAVTYFSGKLTGAYEKKWAKEGGEVWHKMDYITRRTEDFSMAKDIRLYNMEKWFDTLFLRYRKKRLDYKAKEMEYRLLGETVTSLLETISYIAFYGVLVWKFIKGMLPISDVILYNGMISGFILQRNNSMTNVHHLINSVFAFRRYQEFISCGEDMEEEAVEIKKAAPQIELRHVSFAYPSSEYNIIDDMSLKIDAGEKIAVVGLNGAGKTTLMKLICGLLHPTKGKILLNGVDMETMKQKQIYAWFSCVFQDVHFLPLSVRENISMKPFNGKVDERVWECLDKAGMSKEISELSQKENTLMEKSLNDDATDFSGGQRQKLMLARALYRDSGVLILDEPTAALDAIAENDIYQKYAHFTQGKTSFFVSHRLSSTQFCDRIILIDGGKIAEEGTHKSLLEKGGIYAKMFSLQSRYYQKKVVD